MRTRLYAPSLNERETIDALRDQAKRFLELVELGAISSLEGAIGYFESREDAYDHIHQADRWVMNSDGLMDQQATIDRERKRRERKAHRVYERTQKGGDQDTEGNY